MNLQPLFDVKSRLEQAAIAGTGLLAEDFRLQRAAENLKPLASASPVFAKIDSGLQALLSAPAEERSGQLLDLLALVDAVTYTQGTSGITGELSPLPAGIGTCEPLSYGQLQPLLEALTSTGGGRMNLIKDTWENHPEYFTDFRVLPCLILGLGEGYAELADLIADILKTQKPEITSLMKKDFEPAGKRDMVRRVEVISALEGAAATPWLREVLPEAKKDVRTAIITALGVDPQNADFLLELSNGEKGSNRDAVLQGLALREGEEIQKFWSKEVEKNGHSIYFLAPSSSDWASDLTAAGLRDRIEKVLAASKPVLMKEQDELQLWLDSTNHKSSPAMLDFWRFTDEQMDSIRQLKNHNGRPMEFDAKLTDQLLYSLCDTGTKPLCDLCKELWEKDTKQPQWLSHAFLAALLTCPAAEVYDRFSPYVLTAKPLTGAQKKQEFHDAVLRGLSQISWDEEKNTHVIAKGNLPLAQSLDSRWMEHLTKAFWRTSFERQRLPFSTWEQVDNFDIYLVRLFNPSDEKMCAFIVPWLRERAVETGYWDTYSRWIIDFGGSPRGILGESMKKSKRVPYLYLVWKLLSEASGVLSPEEIVSLLEEIHATGLFRKSSDEMGETVFMKTIADLQAGRPFPERDAWNV